MLSVFYNSHAHLVCQARNHIENTHIRLFPPHYVFFRHYTCYSDFVNFPLTLARKRLSPNILGRNTSQTHYQKDPEATQHRPNTSDTQYIGGRQQLQQDIWYLATKYAPAAPPVGRFEMSQTFTYRAATPPNRP